MTLNKEQNDAINSMLSRKNCFITGQAGTGKSTVIEEFKSRCQLPYVVLAPTGIAAVNVHGQTIHSFFSFPPQLLTPDTLKLQKLFFGKRKLIQHAQVIIIDEISMVRADLFYAIDWRLRELAKGPNRKKPFGGKQLIVCGDFFQLSPVVTDPIELEFLKKECQGVYAFETNLWREANFKTCLLTTPHRQQNDRTFIDVLNNVRNGDLSCSTISDNGTNDTAIGILNRHCIARAVTPKYEPVKLCTTNYDAQHINNAARARLLGKAHTFDAIVTGKFPQSEFPTESQLTLIEGARVMVLCNKRRADRTYECANGDLGVITHISDDTLPQVKVRLDSTGEEVTLEMYEWDKTAYKIERNPVTFQDELKLDVIGSFVQIPLRLAYAITIHKSQGLTLDNVDLKLGNGCFAHGQLYTALSRCRTLSGLLLERPVIEEDLILDEKVIDFYKALVPSEPILKNESQTLKMDIPVELKDKVQAFIDSMNSKSENA